MPRHHQCYLELVKNSRRITHPVDNSLVPARLRRRKTKVGPEPIEMLLKVPIESRRSFHVRGFQGMVLEPVFEHLLVIHDGRFEDRVERLFGLAL